MNQKIRPLFLFLIIIFIFLFLFFLKSLGLENILLKPILPLEKFFSLRVEKLNIFFQNKYKMAFLLEENKKLKEELNKILKENIDLKIFRIENEVLKKELNFLETYKFKSLTGRIIVKNFPEPSSIVILNKGEKEGIRPGWPVIYKEGILVGKIYKTYKKTSEVLLLNSAYSKVAGTLSGERKTLGLVQGEYKLGLKMIYIPKDTKLKKGDLIVTSGIEDNIPQGLIIGKIEKIKSKEEEPFQEAILTPYVSYDEINIVNILIPEENYAL